MPGETKLTQNLGNTELVSEPELKPNSDSEIQVFPYYIMLQLLYSM